MAKDKSSPDKSSPVSQITPALVLLIVASSLIKDPIQKYSANYDDMLTKTEPPLYSQFLVPTHIRLKHFRSALHNDNPGNLHLCKLLHPNSTDPKNTAQYCTSDDKQWLHHSTRSYIHDEIFDEKKSYQQYVQLHKLGVSPFHRVMILSGCYGNYRDDRHPA